MDKDNVVREIRTLDQLPLERIRMAFINAFSDYEVRISMPMEKFQGMIRTRDLDLSRSIGCFEGDSLVGFILVGCRHLMGREFWYDGGNWDYPREPSAGDRHPPASKFTGTHEHRKGRWVSPGSSRT